MEIIKFVLSHWILCLWLLCGLIWLYRRLSENWDWRRNWDRMTGYNSSTFGGWTPLIGIIAGPFGIGLMIWDKLSSPE